MDAENVGLPQQAVPAARARDVFPLALVIGAGRRRPDEDDLAAARADFRDRVANVGADARDQRLHGRRPVTAYPHANGVLAQPRVRLDLAPQHGLAILVSLRQLPGPQVRPRDLAAIRDVELVY